MSDNNELKRKYMQWCDGCPKAYDNTCSGADVKRCEAEKKTRIFKESLKNQTPYVEKEPVKIQPVKRGRWFHINNDGIIYCSECNNEAYWDTDYGQQLFDYCPYCGAKMIKDGDTNG